MGGGSSQKRRNCRLEWLCWAGEAWTQVQWERRKGIKLRMINGRSPVASLHPKERTSWVRSTWYRKRARVRRKMYHSANVDSFWGKGRSTEERNSCMTCIWGILAGMASPLAFWRNPSRYMLIGPFLLNDCCFKMECKSTAIGTSV